MTTSQPVSRYLRNTLIPGFGESGQDALANARVLVVGAGGLGSPALLYLAAAGIGHFTVADADAVEESNLQRQIIHTEGDVGQDKTESAARAIRERNSAAHVETIGWITEANADDLCRTHDAVLACTDNFEASYVLADACARTGTPLVWGTVVSMSYQVSVFTTRPPAGQPAVTLRDLHREPPLDGAVDGAREIGVLGGVVGQAGSMMATEAIKLITGIGQPLIGRVLVADARAGDWDVIEFKGAQ